MALAKKERPCDPGRPLDPRGRSANRIFATKNLGLLPEALILDQALFD
jgi:hypothetical protein